MNTRDLVKDARVVDVYWRLECYPCGLQRQTWSEAYAVSFYERHPSAPHHRLDEGTYFADGNYDRWPSCRWPGERWTRFKKRKNRKTEW